MKTCIQCGTPMTNDSPEGLCARCLLSVAVRTETPPPAETVAQAVSSMRSVATAGALGPIQLIRKIGEGGMGEVWLGRHELLGRNVAVKFLLGAVIDRKDPAFTMFVEGARAAASLEHPGLNKVYHADVADGVPYLVLELLDGPNLSDVVQRSGPLDLRSARTVLEAIGEAVAELNQHDLIHRDLKPSNVMVTSAGRVVVTDFGLACARPAIPGGSAALAGTPAYMAPEMFEGIISAKTDVYAFGMTAYHLLSGRTAFSGGLEEQRQKHRNVAIDIEPLRAAGVPQEVIDVVVRALSKDALFRPKTAWHVLESLRAAFNAAGIRGAPRDELARTVRERAQASGTKDRGAPMPTSGGRVSETVSELAARKRGSRPMIASATPDSPTAQPAARPLEKTTPLATASTPIQFCGKCEYCIQGLETSICPECGSDLRVVGIFGPSRKRYWMLAAYVIGWTFASFLLSALFCASVAKWVLPYAHPYDHEQHLERQILGMRHQKTSDPLTEKWSQDFIVVKKDGRKRMWGRRVHFIPPVSEMTIEANRSDLHIPAMHVDLASGGYTFTDASGKIITVPSGFGPSALVRWMSVEGWNASDPETLETANAFLTCINEMSPSQDKDTEVPLSSAMHVLAWPTTWSTTDGEAYSTVIDKKPFYTTVPARGEVFYPGWVGWKQMQLFQCVITALVWLVGLRRIIRRGRWRARRQIAGSSVDLSGERASKI